MIYRYYFSDISMHLHLHDPEAEMLRQVDLLKLSVLNVNYFMLLDFMLLAYFSMKLKVEDVHFRHDFFSFLTFLYNRFFFPAV